MIRIGSDAVTHIRALIVLLLSLGSLTSAPSVAIRPASNAEAWGDPVDGVQLRLAVSKSAPLPLPDELPHFEMQIRNLGKDTVTYGLVGSRSDLEVDGVRYPPPPSADNSPHQSALVPGAQSGMIPLVFQSFRVVDGRIVTFDQLGLKPGKHSVCVRTPGAPLGVQNSAHQVITLVSNVIAIETAAAAEPEIGQQMLATITDAIWRDRASS